MKKILDANEYDAFIVGKMRAKGIPVEIRGGNHVAGVHRNEDLSEGLYVPDEFEIDAMEIVRRIKEGNLGGQMWTCSNCGTEHEAQFEACWKCAKS